MKSVKTIKSWYALFFGSFRRQPSSNYYRYKDNVPKIRKTVIDNFKNQLRDRELAVKTVGCSKALEWWSVDSLRKLLTVDVNTHMQGSTCLQLVRADLKNSVKDQDLAIIQWARVAPIFSTTLAPRYKKSVNQFNTNRDKVGKTLEYAVKLVSKDGTKELKMVAWPDPKYSLSCQGIGVTDSVFRSLTGTEFYNPANNTLLKLYTIDFVPEGSDAIGLFPSIVKEHRKVFSGLDLCGSLIIRKLCTGDARKRVTDTLSRGPDALNSQISIDMTSDASNTNIAFKNVKTMMDRIRTHKLLWSKKKEKSKICPGDIIRCVLFSENVSLPQFEEEYCKHYVVYSIISQTIRIRERLKRENHGLEKVDTCPLNLNPFDHFIWERFQHFNSLRVPVTFPEILEYKKHYDKFLELLSSYHFNIVAEMKASGQLFYAGDFESRAYTIFSILTTILRDFKPIKIFNPNMGLYMGKFLTASLSEAEFSQITTSDSNLIAQGKEMSKIILSCIELEHLVYADKFTVQDLIQVQPLTSIRDWKIVLKTSKPISEDLMRVIKFNTRINTQFVTDLADITQKSFSICQAKRMIDDDLFIFLYKTERSHSISRDDLISDVISKIETTHGQL